MMGSEADEDEKALRAFVDFKDAYTIDYKRINDDDVLVDAMAEADTLDLKKILMRYRRLKNEAVLRDPVFAQRILKNYFSCIRKVGVLIKKQEGSFFGVWDSRFVVLTNAGFMYFKAEQLKNESDMQPQNFKPLNDFCVVKVPAEVSVLYKTFLGRWRPQVCFQSGVPQDRLDIKGHDAAGSHRARHERMDPRLKTPLD